MDFLEHVDEPQRVLAEAARALQPGVGNNLRMDFSVSNLFQVDLAANAFSQTAVRKRENSK